METLTLQQLRTAFHAGGVTAVALEAIGAEFVVSVVARSGGRATLVTSGNRQPRRFGDPRIALKLLKDLGVLKLGVSLAAWTPGQRDLRYRRPDRSAALKRVQAPTDAEQGD